MADHGVELPTTTLITSDYVRVRNSNSFGNVFDSDTPTVRALIRFKTFGRFVAIKPQKLCVTLAAITLKLWVGHGKILLPTVALSTNQEITRMYKPVIITCYT